MITKAAILERVRDAMFRVTRATGAYAALVSVVSGTIMWFNFRPLGIFFCSALAIFWARQYANLRLQISPLFEEKLRSGARRALELRASRPGLSYALAFTLLLAMAIIGHVVATPYIVVTLLVLAIVISTKYDVKIVADREPAPSPSLLLDQEVADFLPELTEANASLLKQVGEDADVSAVYKPDSATISERPGNTDDDDDDTYSDLLMPQNSIRELEEAEAEEDRSSSSGDELLLGSDHVSAPLPLMATSAAAMVPAAESSGEIRFKSSHFNANTSSDSDDSISRGLSFDDVPDRGVAKRKSHHHHHQYEQQVRPQQQQDQLAALAGNLLTRGNLLSYLTTAVTAVGASAAMSQSQPGLGASSHARQQPNRMTVSSTAGGSRRSYAAPPPPEVGDSTDEDGDSDFEMLNPDELNNV